jgi:hypothetical protein
MRTVFRVFLISAVVLNLVMGGVVPAMACHAAKTAMKKTCCCCDGQAMQEGVYAEDSTSIVPAGNSCVCDLNSGDGQAAPEFTLNKTTDRLQYTIIPAGITTAAAHIQNGLLGAKSMKNFCAFESPPLYKLTSSYLC